MLKTYLNGLFTNAMAMNRQNIIELVENRAPQAFVDLGCDDGEWTMKVAQAAKAIKVSGVELVPPRAEMASKKSVEVSIADLNGKLPYQDNLFDLVHANQVIEHVSDVDNFASEVFRILKPGGVAVVSTENGSSWHNIFAAIFGWQTFSLTNMSKLQAGVGNPLALLRNQPIEFGTWTHKVIFNYRGLSEFFKLHGFTNIKIKGAGYYPLPSFFGCLDPRHSHFITIRAQKPG